MRGFAFIISLILVVGSLFLASGAWTFYAGHEYWDSQKAGFPTGFIHGVISPIMILISLFTDYTIYETNNSGWFYDFFFILGIIFVWAGGAGGSKNVIKNYYNAPQNSQQQDNNHRLHDSDIKKIGKLIDKKVVHDHRKSGDLDEGGSVSKDGFLRRIFLGKPKTKKKRSKRKK